MSARRRRALLGSAWFAVCALVLLRQLGREVPTVFLDELTYGRLAINIADGAGFTYQGTESSFRTVYPFLISPAWSFFESTGAYQAALTLNTVVMSSTILPAYAIARRTAASFNWALAAAVAAVLTPSMVWAGMLMTEALAYPLAALALFAILHVLDRPSARNTLLACGAIALAVSARPQMLVLLVVYGVALAAELVRHRSDLWAGVRLHTGSVVAVGGLALAGLVIAAAGGGGLLGTHERFIEDAPEAWEFTRLFANYVAVLALASLIVPLLALVALCARRSNWRDERVARLLVVALAASLGFMATGAWTSATISPELFERYVFYATPALTACIAALPGRAGWRSLAVAGAALFLYLIPAIPSLGRATTEWGEKYSFYGLDSFLDRMGREPFPLSALGDALGWAIDTVQPLAWATLVLGALGVIGLQRGGRWAVAVVLPTLLFGLAAYNVRQTDANNQSEVWAREHRGFDWIDELVDGPVGVLRVEASDRFAIWHSELWNRSVDRVYGLGVTESGELGQVCPLAVGTDGILRLEAPCAGRSLPRHLLLPPPDPDYELPGARVLGSQTGSGTLVELPADEPPRIRFLR